MLPILICPATAAAAASCEGRTAGRQVWAGSIPTPRRLGWAVHDLVFSTWGAIESIAASESQSGLQPVIVTSALILRSGPRYSQLPASRRERGAWRNCISLLRHRNGRAITAAGRTTSPSA